MHIIICLVFSIPREKIDSWSLKLKLIFLRTYWSMCKELWTSGAFMSKWPFQRQENVCSVESHSSPKKGQRLKRSLCGVLIVGWLHILALYAAGLRYRKYVEIASLSELGFLAKVILLSYPKQNCCYVYVQRWRKQNHILFPWVYPCFL